MQISSLVKTWVKKLLSTIQDFLVPEGTKVAALLQLPERSMHQLLPHSPVKMQDVWVLFDYNNRAVRLIVKNIKYQNNQSLRHRIASYCYEEIMEMISDLTFFGGSEPVLVPMPMSKKEKRERGFNQTEEICRAIENFSAKEIKVAYHLLHKIRETSRQTTLSRSERLRNVNFSMTADPKLAHNKTIIVLDDVYTTGASFSEAARALKSAGAKRVIGLFIAH
jgi:ComF family protein